MKKLKLIAVVVLLTGSMFGQEKYLFTTQSNVWMMEDIPLPNIVNKITVYKDSITVKLIKGNSKAMDKLIGTPKFTRVFVGNVEVTGNEFLLKTKEYRVTVTRGGKVVYTTVEEKDDFSGTISKNIYFNE